MVIVTIRPIPKGFQYSTISLDEKLESLIKEDKEGNLPTIKKMISKEFDVDEPEIDMFWIAKKL